MAERHECHANDSKNGFLETVRNGKRSAHEGQPRHRDDEGCCNPVAHCPPANGHPCDQGCGYKTDTVDIRGEELGRRLWTEIAPILGGDPTLPPPVRVIKERRATLAQTPALMARRPPAATPWRNLALAGDWTATGLPATIEGAIRSGNTAAALLSGPRMR